MRAGPNSELGHIANPTSLGAPVQPRSANRPSRHCGTGIGPDRDITGSWRDVDEPCASLPAVPPGRARAHRGNCRLFDTGRRNLARDRLSAGGDWIRNFSSAREIGFGFEACSFVCRRESLRVPPKAPILREGSGGSGGRTLGPRGLRAVPRFPDQARPEGGLHGLSRFNNGSHT